MRPAPPGEKWCGGCESSRPVADFNKNRTMTDGLQGQCRACSVENRKFLRAKHKLIKSSAPPDRPTFASGGPACAICGRSEGSHNGVTRECLPRAYWYRVPLRSAA